MNDQSGEQTPPPPDVPQPEGGGPTREQVMAKIEREDRDKKKKEVRDEIENGTDREGALLRNTIVDVITTNPDDNPPIPNKRMGRMNESYQRARTLAEDMDTNANQVLTTIREFHRHARLGRYELDVKVPEDASPEQKKEAMRQQLLADLDKMPTAAAMRELQPYVDEKAEAKLKEDKLRETLSGDHVNRAKTRKAAYQLERSENRVKAKQRALAIEAGRLHTVELQLTDLREERLSYVREEFGGIPDDQRDEKYDQTVRRYKQGLGERDAKALEALEDKLAEVIPEEGETAEAGEGGEPAEPAPSEEAPQEEIKGLLTQRTTIEAEIGHQRQQLEEAIRIADAEEICKLAREISQRELDLSANNALLDASAAGLRRQAATHQWNEAFRGFADSFIAEGGDPNQEFKALTGAAKESVASLANSGKESAKRIFGKLAKPLGAAARWTGEKWRTFWTGVDKYVTENVRRAGRWVGARIRHVTEGAQSKISAAGGRLERGLTEVKDRFYRTQDAIHLGAHKVKRSLFGSGALKKHLKVTTGRAIGYIAYSPEMQADLREKVKTRREEIKEQRAEWIIEQDEEYRKNRKEHDRFSKLARMAEKRANFHAERAGGEGEPGTVEEVEAGEPGLDDLVERVATTQQEAEDIWNNVPEEERRRELKKETKEAINMAIDESLAAKTALREHLVTLVTELPSEADKSEIESTVAQLREIDEKLRKNAVKQADYEFPIFGGDEGKKALMDEYDKQLTALREAYIKASEAEPEAEPERLDEVVEMQEEAERMVDEQGRDEILRQTEAQTDDTLLQLEGLVDNSIAPEALDVRSLMVNERALLVLARQASDQERGQLNLLAREMESFWKATEAARSSTAQNLRDQSISQAAEARDRIKAMLDQFNQ